MRMSLAELKRRLTVGARVRLVEYVGGQTCNETRTVAKVQTNAIAFETADGRLSWIRWDKGLKVIAEPDGFKLLWPNGNYLRYCWGKVITLPLFDSQPDYRPAA